MTIVATNLTGLAQNSAATSYVTSSISPAANALVLVSVASNVASSAVPTVTGASGTWTQIATRVDGANSRRITMFRDVTSGSPGSGALTIDFAGVSQTNCGWSVDQFMGVDLSGTHGSGAIVQSVGNSTASGTTTSFSVTLAALGSSSNMAYGMCRNNTAAAITKGANFTALFNSGTALEICSEQALNQTVMDWTWASQTVVSVGLAVEIKAAPALPAFIPIDHGASASDVALRKSALAWKTFLASSVPARRAFPPAIAPVLPNILRAMPVTERLTVDCPLNRDIICAYLPGLGFDDLAGINRPFVPTVTTKSVALLEGPGLSIGSAGDLFADADVRTVTWTNGFTIYARFQLDTLDTVNNFWGVVGSGATTCAIAIAGVGNNGQFKILSTDFRGIDEATCAPLSVNKVHSICITQDNSGGWIMYVDGALSGSGNAVLLLPTGYSGQQIGISSNNGLAGKTTALYMWTRPLSPEDIAFLDNDPYGAFLAPSYDWQNYQKPFVQPVIAPTFVMSPDKQLPRTRDYRATLAATTQPALVIFTPPIVLNLDLLITDDRPMRADVIGVSLRATSAPVWPRAPPTAAITPSAYASVFDDPLPGRPDYRIAMAATTSPVLPVFIPPVAGTQTPSIWFANPDCTLPDWW